MEGLRGARGFYTREDRGVARNFQVAQFWSLGVMATLMVADVLVANLMFDPETVKIRTLDEPPPELSGSDPEPSFEPWDALPSVTDFVLRSRF